MDFVVYDRSRHRVWVPAGNTGSVDVIDAATAKVTRIEGFPTKEVERNGNKRTVGPSSASVGDGVVYVGNRADSSICAIDAASMKKGACLALDSSPDAVAWVAATKEVWVTTPRDKSIRVLDATRPGTLTAKARISLPGEPECYAVDDSRGVFFTNLEDVDKTVAIDLKTPLRQLYLEARLRRGRTEGTRPRPRGRRPVRRLPRSRRRSRRRERWQKARLDRRRARNRHHRLRRVPPRAVRRRRQGGDARHREVRPARARSPSS